MAKWLRFDLAPSRGKTSVWFVVSKQQGETLGEIKWYGGWRRYCFFPFAETLYEQDCLRSIAEFCETETCKHRQQSKAAIASEFTETSR